MLKLKWLNTSSIGKDSNLFFLGIQDWKRVRLPLILKTDVFFESDTSSYLEGMQVWLWLNIKACQAAGKWNTQD